MSRFILLGILSLLCIQSINGACSGIFENICQEKSKVPESFHSYFALAKGDSPCFDLYGQGYHCFYVNENGEWGVEECDPASAGCEGEPTECEKSRYSKECYCKISKSNTMCKYSGVDNDMCGKVHSRNIIRKKDKRAIVAKHNELRRKVAKGDESQGVGDEKQPPATDMYKLKWNDELATVAQRWADQCVWDHDKQRGTKDYFDVGQNMALFWSPVEIEERHYAARIDSWYSEVKHFPAANVGEYSTNGATGVVGHYTQVVWGASKEVGCGITIFENKKHEESKKGKYPFIEIFVCNYGPAGNFGPVYTAGETASDCPNGDDDGLCLS